jgi:hypothetical protein
MVREIRIYVEGGGDTRAGRQIVRQGFGSFLKKRRAAARARRVRWNIVAVGPRNSAFDDFQRACREHPRAFNVLLVDSEGPVSDTPWAYLQRMDGWRCDLPDDHCHLMVQTLEAWLVADHEALKHFYGSGFLASAIPPTPDVETIDKETLLSSLNHATRRTQKGEYRKIQHAGPLLKRVRPDRVRSRACHCERLFTVIGNVISGE